MWLSSDPSMQMGHLAWADAFVVTADSVSLISEACSTGYAYEGLLLLLIHIDLLSSPENINFFSVHI